MRSRRLPGQRPQDPDKAANRRPPPPPEPAPLPAEVYFETRARNKLEEAERLAAAASAEPSVGEEEKGRPAVGRMRYGARMVTTIVMLVQVGLGVLMLPRIVNAAELLLEQPSQLYILGMLAVVELSLASGGFWMRSWFGAWSSLAVGVFWWAYLLLRVL